MNIGNTCFFSSFFQILDNLLSYFPLLKINASKNFQLFLSLHSQLFDYSKKTTNFNYLKRSIIELIQKAGFKFGEQNDISEFFLNLVNIMNLEDIFSFKQLSKTICLSCLKETEHSSFENQINMSVPISKSNVNLNECLTNFFEKEICERKCNCSGLLCEKFIEVKEPPKVLLINLKRYISTDSIKKIKTIVDYQKSINICGLEYYLVSISYHIGNDLKEGIKFFYFYFLSNIFRTLYY